MSPSDAAWEDDEILARIRLWVGETLNLPRPTDFRGGDQKKRRHDLGREIYYSFKRWPDEKTLAGHFGSFYRAVYLAIAGEEWQLPPGQRLLTEEEERLPLDERDDLRGKREKEAILRDIVEPFRRFVVRAGAHRNRDLVIGLVEEWDEHRRMVQGWMREQDEEDEWRQWATAHDLAHARQTELELEQRRAHLERLRTDSERRLRSAATNDEYEAAARMAEELSELQTEHALLKHEFDDWKDRRAPHGRGS